MVLTASVVYRHVFTHNSYGYSSSVRLIDDCERLTTEEQHCANQGGHHPGTNIQLQLFSHRATGTRLKGSGWAPPDNRIPRSCHNASQINLHLVEGNAEAL